MQTHVLLLVAAGVLVLHGAGAFAFVPALDARAPRGAVDWSPRESRGRSTLRRPVKVGTPPDGQHRVGAAVATRALAHAAPLSETSDQRLVRLLQRDITDLDHRLMAAPYEIGAVAPDSASCFSLQELLSEGGRGPLSARLCEELRSNHFAIVKPSAAGTEALQGVWPAARGFFDLPAAQKEAAAGRMRKAEGNVGIIGWGTMPDDNEFLELRVAAGGGIVPAGLDESVPGFTAATDAARRELFALGRTVIAAVATSVGMQADALVQLLDDGSRLSGGQWSSTQHRLCLYHADSSVPFEAHTDTTFLTLIPCASIAGLEVWTQASGWVRPEEHAESEGAVVVMTGEFLQVLTGGSFSAAVHRVTRFGRREDTSGGGAGGGGGAAGEAAPTVGQTLTRLSAPLLVRGVKETAVRASDLLLANAGADEDAADEAGVLRRQLARLDGVTLYDLHRVLVSPPPPPGCSE